MREEKKLDSNIVFKEFECTESEERVGTVTI